MSCFQCDLDIPHVCYAGQRDARWGMNDEAVAALEGAQRHGFMLPRNQHPSPPQRLPLRLHGSSRNISRATSKRRGTK
jgi:hypothetical protein